MADPLHKSSDIPDFSTYPASPADQAPDLPSAARTPRADKTTMRRMRIRREDGRLPLALPEGALQARGRQIGVILGQAVILVRGMQHYADLSVVKDRAAESIGEVAETAAGLKEQAKEQIDHLSAQASDKYADLTDQASQQYDRIRRQAEQAMGEAEASINRVMDRARYQAQAGLQKARQGARRARQDYPVQVILAAGAAGFIVGALLRARRGNA